MVAAIEQFVEQMRIAGGVAGGFRAPMDHRPSMVGVSLQVPEHGMLYVVYGSCLAAPDRHHLD